MVMMVKVQHVAQSRRSATYLSLEELSKVSWTLHMQAACFDEILLFSIEVSSMLLA